MKSKRRPDAVGLMLDGSGLIGWAVMGFAPSLPVLSFGTYPVLTSDDPSAIGARLTDARKWTRGMIAKHRPASIHYEQPFVPMYGRGSKARVSIMTIRFLVCLAGIFEEEAFNAALPCSEVPQGTQKASLSGNGRAEPHEQIAACWARGWEVNDHHQADACGVGKVAVEAWLDRHGQEPAPYVPSSKRPPVAPVNVKTIRFV